MPRANDTSVPVSERKKKATVRKKPEPAKGVFGTVQQVAKAKVKVKRTASSERREDMTRSRDFEKKPEFRKAVRDTYAEQPVARRQTINKNATGEVGKTTRKLHEDRKRGDRKIGAARLLIRSGLDDRQGPGGEKASALVNAAIDQAGGVEELLRGLRAARRQDHKNNAAGLGSLGDGASGEVGVNKKKGGGGLATIAALGTAAGPIAATADALTGAKALKGVLKLGSNAAKDAAELAVTTPSTLYKLGDTLVHDPEKVPGMLAEPYKELAKDPKGFATERPVSTLLMVGPVRVPTRAAGAVARKAGKQTLRRAPARVPGTAIRVERVKSRDAIRNAAQTRADRRGRDAVASEKQVERTVDAFHDASQKAEGRAKEAAAAEAKARGLAPEAAEKLIRKRVKKARTGTTRKAVEHFGATPRPKVSATVRKTAKARREAADAKVVARRQGLIDATARQQAALANARVARARKPGVPPREHDALLKAIYERETARSALRSARADARVARADHIRAKDEFRDAPLVDEATVGRLFTEKADAQAVAKRSPFEATVVKVDDQFGVLPKQVAVRLMKQQKVGTSPATGAKLFRVSRGAFTKAVLPLSKNFVTGQGIEAAGRSVVAGAGPTSYIRARKTLKALERTDPDAAQAVKDYAFGENFGRTGPVREFIGEGKTLREEFADTGLAKPASKLTSAAAAPGIRHVRAGYDKWTRGVFKINEVIERQAQTAMLGKAIKQGPLMERSTLGLSKKAIDDAARGLTETPAQIKYGADVERMYGKYKGFSPGKREFIMHSTPFLPWYINTATFLLKVLPVDHPVHAALLASLDAATEDWRKEHGLSVRGGEQRPDFLFGAGPNGEPLGRFLPFAPKDLGGTTAGLFLPQFSTIQKNLEGQDWKGEKLEGGQLGRAENALLSLLSGFVPGVSQADRVTGISDRHLNKGKNPSVLDGKTLDEVKADLVRLVNPLAGPKRKLKAKGKLPAGMSDETFNRLVEQQEQAAPEISDEQFERLWKLYGKE